MTNLTKGASERGKTKGAKRMGAKQRGQNDKEKRRGHNERDKEMRQTKKNKWDNQGGQRGQTKGTRNGDARMDTRKEGARMIQKTDTRKRSGPQVPFRYIASAFRVALRAPYWRAPSQAHRSKKKVKQCEVVLGPVAPVAVAP